MDLRNQKNYLSEKRYGCHGCCNGSKHLSKYICHSDHSALLGLKNSNAVKYQTKSKIMATCCIKSQIDIFPIWIKRFFKGTLSELSTFFQWSPADVYLRELQKCIQVFPDSNNKILLIRFFVWIPK